MRILRFFKVPAYFLFLCFAVLLLLELSYRYQLIDFYNYEFKSLNPKTNSSSKNVLVVGDSFSTYPNGYVDILREKNPKVNFINTAIPGTGIKQQRLLAEKRLQQFSADEVIYQFYVGNDFLDIHRPINFETLSFFRNIFWKASEHFLVLHYLNYKLAAFVQNPTTSDQLQNDFFSVDTYNNRVKINFSGNPNYLNNTLQMKGEAVETYAIWKKNFEDFTRLFPSTTKILFLLVPHCSQVHPRYKSQMIQLGANLEETNQVNPKLYRKIQEDFPQVHFINPLNYFQKVESENKKLYFGNDPHLNPLGQKKLAKYIQKEFLGS